VRLYNFMIDQVGLLFFFFHLHSFPWQHFVITWNLALGLSCFIKLTSFHCHPPWSFWKKQLRMQWILQKWDHWKRWVMKCYRYTNRFWTESSKVMVGTLRINEKPRQNITNRKLTVYLKRPSLVWTWNNWIYEMVLC